MEASTKTTRYEYQNEPYVPPRYGLILTSWRIKPLATILHFSGSGCEEGKGYHGASRCSMPMKAHRSHRVPVSAATNNNIRKNENIHMYSHIHRHIHSRPLKQAQLHSPEQNGQQLWLTRSCSSPDFIAVSESVASLTVSQYRYVYACTTCMYISRYMYMCDSKYIYIHACIYLYL